MDPNTNQLLRDILETTEENNKLLRKMHRSMVWGRVFRFIYWMIIIGLALGSYYYLQPYLETLWATYQNISSGVDSIQNATSQVPDLGALLKNIPH